MFYTFRSGMAEGPSRPARQAGGSRGGDGGSGPAPGPARSRYGAFKACDRCRLYRIKCGEKPCEPCRANNAKCVWREERAAHPRTASSSGLSSPTRSGTPSPSNAMGSDFTTMSVSHEGDGSSTVPTTVSSMNHPTLPPAPPPPLLWAAGSAPTTPHSSLVGSRSDSSAHRFRRFLKSVSPALAADDACANNPFPPLPQDVGLSRDIAANVEPLTPLNKDQQTYFARLFWTSCGTFFPLMSEVEFQKLFAADWDSLFSESPITAAVVDGLTALGIQCGYAAGMGGRILGFDAAARADPNVLRQRSLEYFARCRDRLRAEGARVTIDAIRCYVLLGLYHLQANQLESAYYIVGLGVRRAHMIKLHQTPPAQPNDHEGVGRILTWWMMYWLDIHCSMQLDRPPAVQRCTVSCPPPPDPRDDPTAGTAPGQAPWKDVSPSAFTFFSSKLTMAMAEALEGAPSSIPSDTSPPALEESAQRLFTSMKSLEAWNLALPSQLMNSREEGSSISSAYTASLVALELGTPDWLQRQRIILELRYSNACMLLQRPFVLWTQLGPGVPGVAEERLGRTRFHAAGAVQQASSMISLLYSIYSKSDILDGLPMALQSLWNAAMTLAAHLYIHHHHHHHPLNQPSQHHPQQHPHHQQQHHPQHQHHRQTSISIPTSSSPPPPGPPAAELTHALSTALVVLESLSHANPEAVRVYYTIGHVVGRLQDATGLRIHGAGAERGSGSGRNTAKSSPRDRDLEMGMSSAVSEHAGAGFLFGSSSLGGGSGLGGGGEYALGGGGMDDEVSGGMGGMPGAGGGLPSFLDDDFAMGMGSFIDNAHYPGWESLLDDLGMQQPQQQQGQQQLQRPGSSKSIGT